MMNLDYTRLSIRGFDIGNLPHSLVRACMKKRGFTNEEEALIYYFLKAWDFDDDADVDECLKDAQQQVKKYGFEDIAELMAVKMYKELRPDSEVCKACIWYHKQFCSYRLCRVAPFEKGCEGWEAEESLKIKTSCKVINYDWRKEST